ncbi:MULTISPECIES: YhcN/YlaJ family sporulation lipoprotein [Clostridia]|uniref:YhcN/YlaJ family sporulation lipoprotein n=1 Tax=Clostridia TaxID=186801 RepID=UPI000EA14325|nr:MULTISPECIES: YhcN/YlaJ family sporulation lipoprotein [Clostridia]NBJ69110.1 YhcN/YlaJ family sporulation lipoprotein [Roseburia sp. 1XD42-34]RKI79534.1 YhcN/YlaJ family sporulation lipoprotein [Clostridium sp. 1xD42-85]
MKIKLFSFIAILGLVLAGCMNNDDNNNGNKNADDNVEQTRYNNNTGEGMTGDRNYDMTRSAERDQDNNNNANRYEVSKEASERITREIDEIDTAYVLTMDNNAYVAAGLDTNDTNVENKNTGNNTANNTNNVDKGNELTDDVKSRIKQIVQSVDADIDNVYVSTNPDFLNLTQNYANDVENGKPVKGFFDQFGNMIERLFPQNR